MDSEEKVFQIQQEVKIQSRIALAETVLNRSKSGVRALSNDNYVNLNIDYNSDSINQSGFQTTRVQNEKNVNTEGGQTIHIPDQASNTSQNKSGSYSHE